MKLIYETLEKAGVSLPVQIFALILLILVIIGVCKIYIKYIKPWLKKVFKIQDDIYGIDDIKIKQKETEEHSKLVEEKMAKFEDTLNKISATLQSITEFNNEMKANSKSQNSALRMMLCNELDKKYRRFLELGYIPDSEFEEYVSMHDAYKGIGGNHTGDAKFDYIMQHLERKL